MVIARFGHKVTLKRFVWAADRHAELNPERHKPVHPPFDINLAENIFYIDSAAVRALNGTVPGPRPTGPWSRNCVPTRPTHRIMHSRA